MKIVYQESKPKTCQNTKQKCKTAFSLTPTPWAPASHKPPAELSVQSAILGHPFRDPELQSTTAKFGGVEQNGGGQQPCPFQMVTEHLLLCPGQDSFPHRTPGSAPKGHQWRTATTPSHSNLLPMDFLVHRSRAELDIINVLRLQRARTSSIFRELAVHSEITVCSTFLLDLFCSLLLAHSLLPARISVGSDMPHLQISQSSLSRVDT